MNGGGQIGDPEASKDGAGLSRKGSSWLVVLRSSLAPMSVCAMSNEFRSPRSVDTSVFRYIGSSIHRSSVTRFFDASGLGHRFTFFVDRSVNTSIIRYPGPSIPSVRSIRRSYFGGAMLSPLLHHHDFAIHLHLIPRPKSSAATQFYLAVHFHASILDHEFGNTAGLHQPLPFQELGQSNVVGCVVEVG